MSFRFRIIATLSLIVLLGFLGVARWVRGELRSSYNQVTEDALVDIAHLVAAQFEQEGLKQDRYAQWSKAFERYRSHELDAKIFEYVKTRPGLELYVTDRAGVVVFSSKSEEIGKDYSQWNDVARTLKGEYGARSTRIDPKDSRSSIYFVAAPIRENGEIAGVVTVSKTESSILVFLDRVLERVFQGGLFAVFGILGLGGLVLVWLTWPLERLRQYSKKVAQGERAELPQSSIREIRELTDAFEEMRIAVEGKKTVERYVQSLTHELKSPLTAIQGAAELCREPMDETTRAKFLANIVSESQRSRNLLDRLLEIANLESRERLEVRERLSVRALLQEAADALSSLCAAKKLKITINGPLETEIEGDRFLVFQSVRNLLQNAIDFSPAGSVIECTVRSENSQVLIEVLDEGTGIPEYARGRVFEKFYSLARPDTGKKSSGLGLSFVQEVLALHGGEVSVESPVRGTTGTRMMLKFPGVSR